ncbi:MAG: T9SS type A sorting domain-containing protein [Cyclobacteriaceae bacterium]|nr:T9SS type A sorting domain-containing protein [Cyclobacteriaceae bacterium]
MVYKITRESLLTVVLLSTSYFASSQILGEYQSAATGPWNVAGTWQVYNGAIFVAAATPPTGNEPLITIRAGHNVTMPHVAGPTNPAFTVTTQLDIQATGTLTVATFPSGLFTKFTLTGVLNNLGTINVTGAGVTYIGIAISSGGVVNNSGTIGSLNGSKIRFNSGGTYNHNFNSIAGTIPNATWDSNSNCIILLSGDLPPNGLSGQNFGNFEWNNAQTGDIDLAGALTSVQGNLILRSNNLVGMTLDGGSTAYNLSIGGSLLCYEFFELYRGSSTAVITVGGSLTTDDPTSIFSSYLAIGSGTGSTTVSVGGDLSLLDNSGTGFSGIDMSLGNSGSSTISLAGNLIISNSTILTDGFGSGNYELIFNGSNQNVTSELAIDGNVDITVSGSSVLSIPAGPGDNFLGSNGLFTLQSGTTLRAASSATAGAIQSGTSAGSLRFSSKQFDAGSTIEYNGASQFIGSGHPSISGVNTVINNSSGNTTLASNVTIGGNLTLTSGNISVSAQTLTLNGNFTPGGNSIAVTSSSSLSIGGSGAFGTLVTSGSTTINNFTINRNTTGSVTLGSDLTIGGTLTQTLGDIVLNGRTLTLEGPYVRTNGSFNADAAASLIVSGSGALPAAVTFSGALALNTLAINRASATFPTNSTLTITNLNLLAGTFNNTGTITVATNGVITRTEGSIINNTPQAQTSYDIVYNIANDIATGSEIPAIASQLRNVTKTGGAALTLSQSVTINGNLTLSNGSFNAGANTVNLAGNFVANSTSILTSSPFVFSGNTTISGGALVQFGAVTITGVLTPSINIRIDGDLINNGTLNAGSGTTTFGGTTTISGASSHNFNNVSVTGTLTAPSAMNVAGDFGSTGTFNAAGGLVTFNGTSTVTGTPTFHDITVSGALTGSANLSLTGHLRINGTFNHNSGTVSFVGTANQRIDRTVGIASTIDFFNITVNKSSGTFNVFSTISNTIFRVQNNFSISQNGASSPDVDFDGPSNNGTFVLRSTASRTAKVTAVPSGVTVSGLLTAERFVQNSNSTRAWRYFASPLIGATVADWQGEIQITGQFSNPSPGTGSNNPSLYRWTETNGGLASNRWNVWPNNVAQPASAFAITNTRGYSVFVRDTGTPTVDVRGTLATGNVNIGLTRTGTEVDAAGFNLVGNPYPAPIDWDLVTLPGGVSSTISMLDEVENAGLGAGTFVYYVQGGPAFGNFDGVIASGQAFWVELTTGSSATLTITESHKVSDINPIVVKEKKIANMLRVNLQGVDSRDETIIYFNDDASSGLDSRFDASKRINEGINLYTFFDNASEQLYAINGVNQTGCSSSFRLGINDWDIDGHATTPSGSYNFDFSEMGSFTGSYSFILQDNYEGTSTDIMTNSSYSFEVSSDPASYGDHRFELLIVNKTASPDLTVVAKDSEATCKEGSVTLSVEGAPVGGSYRWYESNDAEVSISGETSAQFVTPILQKSKTYYVESYNAEGCRSKRIPVLAEVVNYDNASITESAGQLISSFGSGNQWYKDDVIIAGAVNQVLTPTESGLYKVVVTVGSCQSSSERTFFVTGDDDWFFDKSISTYPNPVTDLLHVTAANNIPKNPRILDLTGRPIGEVEIRKTASGRLAGTYDFSDKSEGVYILQVVDENGSVYSKRIVKK